VPKPLLTVILAHSDLAAQAAHLARGALFLPEPEPLPEPFAEITLRVETAAGSAIEIDGRVLQILPGHGIAVAFDDTTGARTKLGPLFAEPADGGGGGEQATFVFWGRTGEKDREAREGIELDETAKVEAEIAGMNTNQKMQLAMRGSRVARTLLLKDVNKNLQTFIIQNPKITLEEVRMLAANRQANPDVLNTIAANKDWGNNPNIITALVRNPKTPPGTAAKLVEKVPMTEVRRLAKAADVPRVVVAAARRRLDG
jgi:hypothetical protein